MGMCLTERGSTAGQVGSEFSTFRTGTNIKGLCRMTIATDTASTISIRPDVCSTGIGDAGLRMTARGSGSKARKLRSLLIGDSGFCKLRNLSRNTPILIEK